jgi:N-acylneuraminate cytidylyltransferase
METLFLITARGGSKGIPKKNIKILNGKPLIQYSLEIARQFTEDSDICISTDDAEIIDCCQKLNYHCPFVRPSELATDEASSKDVILHALDFYKSKNKIYKNVVLLQPTSPLRLKEHVKSALELFHESIDLVIGVKITKSNPYQLLYQLNQQGNLEKVMNAGNYDRRQDMPTIYEVNGAVYVYNYNSLMNKRDVSILKPLVMPAINSVDIDDPLDWSWAEFLMEKKLVKLDY